MRQKRIQKERVESRRIQASGSSGRPREVDVRRGDLVVGLGHGHEPRDAAAFDGRRQGRRRRRGHEGVNTCAGVLLLVLERPYVDARVVGPFCGICMYAVPI